MTSESCSSSAYKSAEGASATSSIQSESDVHGESLCEQQCTALSESECVAPLLSACHVTKPLPRRSGTDSPPSPTLVATKATATRKKEPEGVPVNGSENGSVGALDKEGIERFGERAGVGEASRGATQEESKGACGRSPDGSTIISGDQNTSLKVESQTPSKSGDHGQVNVRYERREGCCTWEFAVKCNLTDAKDLALDLARELSRDQERNPSSQPSLPPPQSLSLPYGSDIHNTIQNEIPKLHLRESDIPISKEPDNSNVYTNKN